MGEEGFEGEALAPWSWSRACLARWCLGPVAHEDFRAVDALGTRESSSPDGHVRRTGDGV